MSGEDESVRDEDQVTASEAVNDQFAEADAAASPELADEARKYGWRPKEEYDRDPEGWVDADRFLEMPKTQIKMLRDQKRDTERQLRERDDRIASIESATRTAMNRLREQERERYEADLAKIRETRREAFRNADEDTFNRAEEQEKALKPPAPSDDGHAQRPAVHPDVQAYLDRNDWTKDPEMMGFAFNAINANPVVMGLPPLRQVEWAEKQVKEFFSDKFPSQQKPQQRSRVDGGGLAGGQRRSGKGADDLPSEAKTIGAEFVKDGLFKSLDEYAKSYFEQGGTA